jgi:hypothetical protein
MIKFVMAEGKGNKEATTRRNYKVSLVKERITGKRDELFISEHMERGTEREPGARQEYNYSFRSAEIEEVGFIDHPLIVMSGASPDGLADSDGLIEIKCPTDANHLEYIFKAEVPSKHKQQMTWQMECTGRKWCDFVSFNPEFPHGLKIFIIRYEYDPVLAKEIREEVVQFLEEVDIMEEVLRRKMVA